MEGILGIGDPDVFGLGAVDKVPEDPADAGLALLAQAVGVEAALAVGAVPAGLDAGDDEPISVMVPTPSWPRILPLATAGTSPLRMWRSVPQMVVVSTLTITSLGFWIVGSGTSVQDFSPGPP
jgi:hypothetical protein